MTRKYVYNQMADKTKKKPEHKKIGPSLRANGLSAPCDTGRHSECAASTCKCMKCPCEFNPCNR